jgi:hypothetical protein
VEEELVEVEADRVDLRSKVGEKEGVGVLVSEVDDKEVADVDEVDLPSDVDDENDDEEEDDSVEIGGDTIDSLLGDIDEEGVEEEVLVFFGRFILDKDLAGELSGLTVLGGQQEAQTLNTKSNSICALALRDIDLVSETVLLLELRSFARSSAAPSHWKGESPAK